LVGSGSLGVGSFACVFDGSLSEIGDLAALDDAALVDAAWGWARTENAACARKLAVMAELFARRTGLPAGERELWWVDPQAAVGAELGAAQGISTWMALAQAHRGVALGDRLPKVAALFEAGFINEAVVRTIEYRTAMVTDDEAIAVVDGLLADQVTAWGPLSARKTEQAIDAIVDQVDPGALRRSRETHCGRDVVFGSPSDEAGYTSMWARLYAPDAEVLEQRVQAMVRGVCEDDPRTMGDRRSDAFAAIGAGIYQLACECANTDCPAAGGQATRPSTTVIHVVADAAAVEAARAENTAGTPAADAAPASGGSAVPDVQDAPAAEAPDADTAVVPGPAFCPPPAADPAVAPACPASPAFVIGAGVLPTPLLAATLERATVREIVHPGDGPAEPRYTPSRALADFVRCRDLTCRFPGCDRPATHCDLDHTVPYPVGPTHASNLKCLCRFHHLLKTFWCGIGGWRDRQLPDGTVIWTSPTGHTYTTKPGSALWFPRLCLPTGALRLPEHTQSVGPDGRGAMMPKRRRTRADNLHRRIQAERKLNDEHVAERNRPPPF
jgi:Domain of unknown function (DUF222)